MPETKISFDDISFSLHKEGVKATFMKNYSFFLSIEDLERIASFEVRDGALFFADREKRVWNKLNLLLDKGFGTLRHKVRDKSCLYIHQNSGIPLIGSNEFGLVDRGSNIIEVKPLTGCNLSCTFCSVDEGVNNKSDIVVEEEYLVSEFKKLAQVKKHDVEANIGPQGEPLLYPKFVELVRDLKSSGAKVVSVNTNGTLLYPQLIDELHAAGLDRINLSLHALDQQKVNDLMGGVQGLPRLLDMIKYCENKIDVLLAPVLIPGLNDDQLGALVELSKSIHNKVWPTIGVQNFLEYPGGRNPGVKQRSWDDFFKILQEQEEKFGVSLTLKGGENVFNIHADDSLPKPFSKGDVIVVEIKAKGRVAHEFLGVAQNRVITVKKCDAKIGAKISVRLLRDKHNIFIALPA